MTLSKCSYDHLPLVFQRMFQSGYDKETIRAMWGVISGLDRPQELENIRDYATAMMEIEATIANTLKNVEDEVMAAIQDGTPVKGYAVTQSNRRFYTDELIVEDILANSAYGEEDYLKMSLIGIPALEKLLKDNPDVKQQVFEHIDTKVGKPILKRK